MRQTSNEQFVNAGKRHGWVVVTLIIAVLGLVSLLLWWGNPIILMREQSVSPDGAYLIRVGWNEKERWPHHVPPLDVELQGYQTEPKKRLFSLYTTLEHDEETAQLGDDIRILWESDSRATVLILGRLQFPEIITIDFQPGKPEITRECSRTTYDTAREIFLSHGIPLSELDGILYFGSPAAMMEYDFQTAGEVKQALSQLDGMDRIQQISKDTYQSAKAYLDEKLEELKRKGNG